MWKTRFLVCLSVIRVLIKYSLSTRVLGAHCKSNTRFQKNIWVCITITNGGEIKIPCHQQRAPPSKEKNARLLPPLQQSAEQGLAGNLFIFLKRLIWHLTICWAGPGWKFVWFFEEINMASDHLLSWAWLKNACFFFLFRKYWSYIVCDDMLSWVFF